MSNQLKLKNSTKTEPGININDSYSVDTVLLAVCVPILGASELKDLSKSAIKIEKRCI